MSMTKICSNHKDCPFRDCIHKYKHTESEVCNKYCLIDVCEYTGEVVECEEYKEKKK